MSILELFGFAFTEYAQQSGKFGLDELPYDVGLFSKPSANGTDDGEQGMSK